MKTFNLYGLIITAIFIFVGVRVMEWRALRLTASVCHLYETLKVVADKMEDEEVIVTPNVLTYYEHN